MRLGPNHDQMIQHAFEDRGGLGAPHSAPGSKNRRAPFARGAFVEMDGHVAILVVVGVEQRQLLCTVGNVIGVVDVQDDLLRRLVVGLDEAFQQGQPDTVEVGAADTVFQATHGRLTGQIGARQGEPTTGGLEARV